MKGSAVPLVLAAVAVLAFTAGWVFRDARARGLPLRKALTWAALTTQEWPLLLLLYRRTRPRRIRADAVLGALTGSPEEA
jgi:hypothetical protein